MYFKDYNLYGVKLFAPPTQAPTSVPLYSLFPLLCMLFPLGSTVPHFL